MSFVKKMCQNKNELDLQKNPKEYFQSSPVGLFLYNN